MTFMGVDDLLVLIPAYNEAASLPSVLAEVRALVPGADILVIDDGSSDGTFRLVDRLGVRVLRIHERIGVGGAVRTGLRYAGRLGYSRVVRVDGDGQHRPSDIDALMTPITQGVADVTFGSRYAQVRVGIVRRTLAMCLTALTGRQVTDPTSGFCALGPGPSTCSPITIPRGTAKPNCCCSSAATACAPRKCPWRSVRGSPGARR